MKLQTAIEILEYHQEWRLGKREDMIHEPKKLTEALDIVLSEVKKLRLGAVIESLPDSDEIDEQIDKYAFRVPYDGSNNFYDEVALKHYKAGIEWLLSRIRGNVL